MTIHMSDHHRHDFVNDVVIYPKFPNSMMVSWKVRNPALNSEYFFYVWLAAHPEHEFKKVNEIPIVNKSFYEFEKPLTYKTEYLYAKVECVVDGHSYMSEANGMFYNLQKPQYLIARDIMRRKDLVRRKKKPIIIFVLKRRVFGAKCTECTEVGTGASTNSRCMPCYGTGIVGGYYEPIKTACAFEEAGGRATLPSTIGNIDQRGAVLKFTFPIVEKDDIIIEEYRNRRWAVEYVDLQMLSTYPVDQVVKVNQISTKDIQYQIDITGEN